MKAFQQRVVDEKKELDGKLEGLAHFIRTNKLYDDLPDVEQSRLNAQFKIMEEYSRILGERIANFQE